MCRKPAIWEGAERHVLPMLPSQSSCRHPPCRSVFQPVYPDINLPLRADGTVFAFLFIRTGLIINVVCWEQ